MSASFNGNLGKGSSAALGASGSETGWIHDLARAEVHPDAERLLQLGRSQDPQVLVEESAIAFLTELREQIQDYARVFNAYSEGGVRFQEVKVYPLAQSAADFMIYRNQVKLVVAHAAHGVIQISYAQHKTGGLAVDGRSADLSAKKSAQETQDLLAQVGPFREVYWTYQGEKVAPEQVGKYIFGEFTRMSRDSTRSRGSNQALLDQIKALLEEKGLQL